MSFSESVCVCASSCVSLCEANIIFPTNNSPYQPSAGLIGTRICAPFCPQDYHTSEVGVVSPSQPGNRIPFGRVASMKLFVRVSNCVGSMVGDLFCESAPRSPAGRPSVPFYSRAIPCKGPRPRARKTV